jgi:hypothetical protein
MEINQNPELGDPKDEYLDICETIRHFGNIRFAQMTLFLAITAGMLTVVFQNETISLLASMSLKIGGMIIALLFWTMDARAMTYWHHFRERAIVLEETLGFQQWSHSPATKFISTTNAIQILYSVVIIFWVITVIWGSEY